MSARSLARSRPTNLPKIRRFLLTAVHCFSCLVMPFAHCLKPGHGRGVQREGRGSTSTFWRLPDRFSSHATHFCAGRLPLTTEPLAFCSHHPIQLPPFHPGRPRCFSARLRRLCLPAMSAPPSCHPLSQRSVAENLHKAKPRHIPRIFLAAKKARPLAHPFQYSYTLFLSSPLVITPYSFRRSTPVARAVSRHASDIFMPPAANSLAICVASSI